MSPNPPCFQKGGNNRRRKKTRIKFGILLLLLLFGKVFGSHQFLMISGIPVTQIESYRNYTKTKQPICSTGPTLIKDSVFVYMAIWINEINCCVCFSFFFFAGYEICFVYIDWRKRVLVPYCVQCSFGIIWITNVK